jgi:LmbE family N-acetylglucosaminyl deacetylase
VAVLSPHLDDAVFSLGAVISNASRLGTNVSVITVLSGDPESTSPPGDWDEAGGFPSAGEASRLRRQEDREACALLGATPVWLPFWDRQYDRGGTDEEIWAAILDAVGKCSALLVPGFPLENTDHRWLTNLVLSRQAPVEFVGLYAEQPYAKRHRPQLQGLLGSQLGGEPDRSRQELRWSSMPLESIDRQRKRQACRAYRSQLPLLTARSRGRSLPRPVARCKRLLFPWEIALNEAMRGGESIAWLSLEHTWA